MSTDADRLQPGAYFRHGETPAPSWRLVLIDIAKGIAGSEAQQALAQLERLLSGLQRGAVPELAGQPEKHLEATRETFAELRWLLGYGASFFDSDLHDPRLTARERPAFVTPLPATAAPFPALPWVEGHRPEGEADLVLQLTGTGEAAVNRAAVELWKIIEDERLPLTIRATFAGFLRPDGRGWLEFHDGVSNIETSQRLMAIAAGGDPDWMEGGTYMVFLRCLIDLAAWRTLERADQELIVGRDKLSGAALVATERDSSGRARPVAAPEPGVDASDAELADYRDPPQTTDPLLEASHIHRANQNRASPHAPAAWRIFRQGYDFLESIGPRGPRLGLNFVSFQADLGALHHILHLPGWLADVNFGGPTKPEVGDPPTPALISAAAGGVYAVPPRGAPFAGASLFEPG